MRKIKKAVIVLVNNPTLFWRKSISWWRRHIMPCPPNSGIIMVHGVCFPYNLDLGSMMSEIYYGDYEPDICLCLESLLKPGDTFIDVGANCGYISTVALGLVGAKGQVHAFEPVPWLYERLMAVAKNNVEYHFFYNQVALGENPGTAAIRTSKGGNIGWNTMVPNFMAPKDVNEQFEVPVIRLSDYFSKHNLQRVDLIKIDVEGFEIPVLKGLEGYLDNCKCSSRPKILCEVASQAHAKLGVSIADLDVFRQKYNYATVDPASRNPLSLLEIIGTTNVLFLPEIRN